MASVSVTGLVDTTVKLYDRVSALYEKHAKLPQDVTSIRSDLRYIEEAISKRSRTAEYRDGSSWVQDLQRAKIIMENTVQYFELEYSSHNSKWTGLGARAVELGRRWLVVDKKLLGYFNEIKQLTTDARKSMDTYQLNPQLQDDQHRTSGEDEEYYHPKVADPVGVETATSDVIGMLRNATLLRVVPISGPDRYLNGVLAEAAYNQVQEKENNFNCKALVTASHDAQKVLLEILDQLGATHQGPPNLLELTQILRDFLANKRYIIGICGVETSDFWDDVRCAFPDDNTSSRIVVTTIKEEIAQSCRKNSTVYSLQATKEDIIQILSMDKAGTGQKVITILGPPACGKTTVAEAAYSKVKVEEEFEYKAWSRATQDGKEFLRDILHQLGAPQPDSMTTPDLSGRLKELLTGKRYIIGIDGLETAKYWNDVLYACPDDNTSSRIVVTTTSKKTAWTCYNNYPSVYMMRDLEKTSALDLLVRKVFGKDGCHNNMHEDLEIILMTCEYLPLAVANIGDYMRGLNEDWDYAKYEKLCISFGSLLVNTTNESFRGIRHMLNRSYAGLSDQAKACLLSLSSYPIDLDIKDHVIKNYDIKVKPLIRCLLAENLVPHAAEDDIINECLNPLVEQNFIIPTEFSMGGHVKTFRVNRMLPQFIKEKCNHENYFTRIDIQQGMNVESRSDITRLYLHNSSSSQCPRIREKIYSTHVRRLTYHGKASKDLMCFGDYTFLRVLNLENCESVTNDILESVCSLRMLKYLSIRGNKELTKLPKNIKELPLLETLDTRDTMVHRLPMDVILLPKIAHLFGKFEITFKKSKFDLYLASVKSCQLQTLKGFSVNESPLFVKLLPFLPKLNKIGIFPSHGAHGGDGSPKMNDLNADVRNDLVQSLRSCLIRQESFSDSQSQSRLRSLSVDFGGCSLDFLNDLNVFSFLDSLKIDGNLSILPEWITAQYNLKELCLPRNNIRHLSQLQSLEKLVSLKLTGNFSDDSVQFEDNYIWQAGWFKYLKRLHLNFPHLPKIVIQKEALPKLQFLQLSCTSLGEFNGIKNLRDLEELTLPSGNTSAEATNLLNQVKTLPKRPRVSRSASGRR